MADGRVEEIGYALQHAPGSCGVDGLVPAALLPAMRLGEPLELEFPVSPRLLHSLDAIQAIFACWAEHAAIETGVEAPFRRVPVTAPPRTGPAPARAGGAACFFTAGVDSIYSVLKHREELTALVFVHGFDVPLADAALRERVIHGVREAAAMLELPLVEVEADLRRFSEPWLDWLDYHGAALASVALLLAEDFGRFYLPSTMTYAMLNPLGSHPIVDPLWSTERLELVHDGCEAARRDKLRAISGCEAARRWLRVCWENEDGAYNCGRCEKCVRTLVELRLLGLSELFESFPELDLTALDRIPIHFGGAALRSALHVAERSGRDPALTTALRSALRRHRLGPRHATGERSTVSDGRLDELEVMTAAAAIAAERDRLAARLAEVERTLASMTDTRAWRTTTRIWATRERMRRRLAGDSSVRDA